MKTLNSIKVYNATSGKWFISLETSIGQLTSDEQIADFLELTMQ